MRAGHENETTKQTAHAGGIRGRDALFFVRVRLDIQTALEQIIVDTYAREGRYPPSLESMIKEHGFTYDPDTYMIVYDIFADNIRPRVQVTERSRP